MHYLIKRLKLFTIYTFLSFYLVVFASDAELKKRLPDKLPLIENNTKELDKLSMACLDFFAKSNDDVAKNVGSSLMESGISQEAVISTLEYINKIQEEDHEHIRLKKKQVDGSPWSYRMSKFWFLSKNFDFYRIYGNQSHAKINKIELPFGKVRVTKYSIFEFEVSSRYSSRNNMEIYAAPEWVNPNTGNSQYRIRYTKEDVFNGVYRKGGVAEGKAKPLAYTNKSNVELVMLQGSFVGCFEDGSRKIFGVAGTNEAPYVAGVKHENQKRYIYFKEQDDIYGYGKVMEEKIKIQPGLTFAADTNNFGIGKLMLMCYEDTVSKTTMAKIGILADTGSAFADNSFHIDFLLGTYNSKKTFYKDADRIPHYCDVYILIKK